MARIIDRLKLNSESEYVYGLYPGYFLMAVAVILGFSGASTLSNILNVVALVSIGLFCAFDLIGKRSYNRKTVIQHFLFSLVVLGWLLAAVHSDMTIHDHSCMIMLWLCAIALVTVRWGVALHISLKPKGHWEWILTAFKACRPIALIEIIILAFLLPFLHYPYLWDSASYLDAMILSSSKWDFTTSGISVFTSLGHQSAGFVFMTQPGVWIFDDWTMGEHIISVTILMITAGMFWMLIRKWFRNLSTIETTIITLLFVLSPAVMVQSVGYHLDWYMTCYVIWVLFAIEYDLKLFQIVFGFLLCFSKEPGILLYAGMMFGYYLIGYIKSDGEGLKKFWNCVKPFEWFRMISLPVVWVLIYIIPRITGARPSGNTDDMGFVGFIREDNYMDYNFKLGISLKYAIDQLDNDILVADICYYPIVK